MEGWLYPDPPTSGDPADVRAYISDLRGLAPQDADVAADIAAAERLLVELERERASAA